MPQSQVRPKPQMKHDPAPKVWREKIGDRDLGLPEVKLDVTTEVTLWDGNPRLGPTIGHGKVNSESDLEAFLEGTKGYDVLRRSIEDIGQMEPVYVWKRDGMPRYLVLEGATRVTILRALWLKHGSPEGDQWRYATAKVLPADFSERERAILLARIHVRGTGVRTWGRYVEAKFVHESVTSQNGQAPLMTMKELADYMGKSLSWVSRLKDAYEFAQRFVDYLDDEEGEKKAFEYFSVLEEIAKSNGFGSKVKDYENPGSASLREEVFEMVRHNVFKEYRDARFMKAFYDNPEKWAQLKTHEEHIANKLAAEERAGSSSLAAKIAALPGQVERALKADPEALDGEAHQKLLQAARTVASSIAGASEFRMELRAFSAALRDVRLGDIESVTADEYEALKKGLADFESRLERHKSWS